MTNECLKPGCREGPEFELTRKDQNTTATIMACRNHTDLFHELVLAVKYGTWDEATIRRAK